MENNQKYLLLVDPKQEILNLQVTALNCFYDGEIHSFTDSSGALEMIKKKGNPEMVVIDSDLLKTFKNQNLVTPIIATSFSPFSDPVVSVNIEKPFTSHAFSTVVKSLATRDLIRPSHVPIKFSVLLKVGIGNFDLFLRLSDKNFVKIFHKGEPFYEEDAVKLSEKGVDELFIKYDDSLNFLKLLELDIIETGQTYEDISLTLENLEAYEKIAKLMKWSPEVILSAERSVTNAVKILSKNQSIMKVLKRRMSEGSASYSQHVGLLTYLVCAFGSVSGLIGESGQIKLALAALVHDLTVPEACYKNIKIWNKKAADPSDKSAETIKYRMHPLEAAKIIKSLDGLSPDVDQIILQHHEVKDGSGFPRSLDASRIGQLPALFIIVENLIDFIDDGDNLETSITDFIMWGREYYDSGHFKKMFAIFDENLKA